MTNEIQVHNPGLTGDTLYAVVRDANTGLVRDVVAGAWDTFVAADIGDYDTPVPETDTGYFEEDFPSLATGLYYVSVHRQAGGSPAATDPVVAEQSILWDGNSVAVIADYQGAAGDPLENLVPGNYESGTGGYIIGMLRANPSITFVSPVFRGNIQTVRGTDYESGLGNAIDIVKPTGALWPPDLTGWTPTATIDAGGTTVTVTGSIVTATGDGQTIRFEPNAAKTTSIPFGSNPGWNYSVLATDGTDTVELIRGHWQSLDTP